jgi:hypothetical protein
MVILAGGIGVLNSGSILVIKHLWIVIAALALAACEKKSDPPKEREIEVYVAPAATSALGTIQWRGVQDNPERAIVARVTIPNVLSERPFLVPVRRFRQEDGLAAGQGAAGSVLADGSNEKGGFGYGGAVRVIDGEGDENTIVLEVDFYWTTGEQVKGKLKENVTVKIGEAAHKELRGGASMDVAWE